MDRAAAVVTDAAGIYVIGNKPPRFPGGRWQAGVGKYDSQGNELWTHEFSVSGGGAQLVGMNVYSIRSRLRFTADGGTGSSLRPASWVAARPQCRNFGML